MNSVMMQARILNQEIKNSPEYLQYQSALQQLRLHGDLYQKTCEFQRRNFQIQGLESGNAVGEISSLREAYKDVLSDAFVNDYLNAEQKFVRMLRHVEDLILSEVDIALDALDD